MPESQVPCGRPLSGQASLARGRWLRGGGTGCGAVPGTGSGKRQQRRQPPPGKVAGSGAAAEGRVGAGSSMGRPREGGESVHPPVCLCGAGRGAGGAMPPLPPRPPAAGTPVLGRRERRCGSLRRVPAQPGGAAEGPGGARCGASPPRPAALPGAFRAARRFPCLGDGGRRAGASLLPAGAQPARREVAGAAGPRSRHPRRRRSMPARAVGAAALCCRASPCKEPVRCWCERLRAGVNALPVVPCLPTACETNCSVFGLIPLGGTGGGAGVSGRRAAAK